MTAEDRDARLTAYALDEPGLTPAARQEIETLLAADPAARRAVDETRQLARLLTAGLTAEQAALPAEPAVVIPSPERTMRTNKYWAKPLVAAAAVLIAVGGTYLVVAKWNKDRNEHFQSVAAKATPGGGPATVSGWQADERGAAVHTAQVRTATTAMARGTGATTTTQRLQAELDQNRSERDELKGDKAARQGPYYDPTAIPDPRATTGAPPRSGPPAKSAPGRPGFGPPGTGGGGLPGLPGPAGGAVPAGAKSPGGLPPGGPGTADLPAGTPPPAPPSLPKPEARSRPAVPALDPAAQPDSAKDAKPRGDTDKAPAETTPVPGEDTTRDAHLKLIENPFTRVEGINALSTFGVDVDTASYSMVRKYLSMGQLPPPSAVRLEEMVNYFPYADKAPDGNDPFAVTVEMADCPWQPKHRLVRLGLKAKPIANDKRPPSNLVFLIDVSGSMNEANKLPLVKASLKLLVGQLGENDRVAMVVYAGNSGIVLDSTSAVNKDKIVEALDRLEAGGSTNGAGGIQDAYAVAAAHFVKNGTNRVILCTDGDWNVGTTSTEALVKLIEEKRKSGVYLSVLGFGMGNLRDEMMVQLAGKGNGNYAYIDTLKEGHKALVEQMGGTLVTVAKDVKIQVEFNPAVIQSYRLLGYEKRALAAKDFHDDTKDAGEMGAGHVVTALYELVPVGAPDPTVGKVDGLRYQKADAAPAPAKGIKTDEAFVLKMRHKKPDADVSTLREQPVKDKSAGYEMASEDFQFAAAVASFAMLLKDSQYKGDSNYGLVLELAEAAKKHDPGGYRAEFIELVKKAKQLSGK